MSTYDKLDSLIVDSIRAGRRSFSLIFNSKLVSKEAERISDMLGRDSDRIVDSRLQALRKRGLIRYLSFSGWVVISEEAA
jgi:hypothetical protein